MRTVLEGQTGGNKPNGAENSSKTVMQTVLQGSGVGMVKAGFLCDSSCPKAGPGVNLQT